MAGSRRPPKRNPKTALNKQAHPLAAHAWASLRDHPRIDRRLVLLACQRQLDIGPTTENQELALRAIGICRGEDQPVPSERGYGVWRSEQQRPGDYPSSSFIRNAFGSWAGLEAVLDGRPLPDPVAARLTTRGKLMPKDRIETAILAWADEVPLDEPLRLEHFVIWCTAQNTDPNSGFTGLPQATWTVIKRFGRWERGLIELGLSGRLAHRGGAPVAHAGDHAATTDSSNLEDLAGAPIDETAYPYSTTGLLRWFDWVYVRAGRPKGGLSRNRFNELAGQIRSAFRARGQFVEVPCSNVYCDRFGSWLAAQRAGGIPAAGLPNTSKRYEAGELEEFAVRAIAECGSAMTMARYNHWREQEEDRTGQRVPRHQTVTRNLDPRTRRWTVAIASVVAQHPHLADVVAQHPHLAEVAPNHPHLVAGSEDG